MIGTLGIEIPLWLVLLYLTFCAAALALSGVGIYYLISKKYDKTSLIAAALLFVALLGPKSPNPFYWAEFVWLFISSLFYPASLIGQALTYSAIFAVVNFIRRFVRKRTLQ